MIISAIHEKLKEIYAVKLQEIERINIDLLPQRNVPLTGFKNALKNRSGMGLIAEIKKASPSKGIIRADFNIEQIAGIYNSLAVDAVSVLTDEQFFMGHKDYLKTVKGIVDCPVLRKDFVIHEKQIYESYAIGADIILLIVAMLSFKELKKLLKIAHQLNLEVITEAHTKEEIQLAARAGAEIIGINNRDLNSFNVDINNCLSLAKEIPKDIMGIAESGIKTHEDIKRIEQAGYHAVLIGEAFMAANNIPLLYKHLFDNDTN